ncbi:MAG: ribosome biogenesis GTP-binding protein YihA/YsxC [Candidatus Sericytochromatia bacterium]|nr:ribosome biogenesis GTP-binding protein YihA/YsxC [Candidatus Sericytochromatia bacterium]
MRVPQARYLTGADRLDRCPPPDQPEVALVGRSNAGKSSTVNMLTNRHRLARVGAKPGVTTLLHFFALEGGIRLVDLPGYGYARVSKEERLAWQGLIESYLAERTNLAGVLWIADGQRPPDELDRLMVGWLRAHDRPFLLLLNKADKMTNAERGRQQKIWSEALDLYSADELMLFSAEKGTNSQKVWAWIKARAAARSRG